MHAIATLKNSSEEDRDLNSFAKEVPELLK
jgi:hypothetical protein